MRTCDNNNTTIAVKCSDWLLSKMKSRGKTQDYHVKTECLVLGQKPFINTVCTHTYGCYF